MQTAAEIYQEHLDMVSQAAWRGDMDAVSAAMAYPHVMYTDDSILRVRNAEDLKASASSFIDSLRRQGATAYHRVCRDADFTSSERTRIEGSHLVHVLNGGTYVTPPFPSSMTLLRVDGTWLGYGIKVSVRNSQITVLNPALVAENRKSAAAQSANPFPPPHPDPSSHPEPDDR